MADRSNWTPWVEPKQKELLKLNSSDPTLSNWRKRRDKSKDTDRKPGLFNPQRYAFSLNFQAFPTFLGAPIAQNADDLRAGKVDVAIVGSPTDGNLVRGANFAPNVLRTLIDTEAGLWGTDPYTRTDV